MRSGGPTIASPRPSYVQQQPGIGVTFHHCFREGPELDGRSIEEVKEDPRRLDAGA